MNTKVFRSHGKRWVLPKVLRFYGGKSAEYDIAWRAPKKGEFFLSGAVVTAYLAFSDQAAPALVVTKRYPVVKVTSWRR